MRGAGDALSVGERIAFYRRRRGLTQVVLAGLVGRSEDWLSKIERGERPLRRLDVLAELATALRVTVGDVVGQPTFVEGDAQRDDDDVRAVRDALMTPQRLSRVLFGAVPSESVDAATSARVTEHFWADFQAGRMGRVVGALPSLISSAQALEDSATPSARDGWAVSARVHHLVASTMSKIGEAALAWTAAERAMQAADKSDDLLVLASAARSGTHALLSVGRYNDAMHLGQTAASWLAGHVKNGDTDALSLLGMLFLRSAVAAARERDRAETLGLLAQARTAAERLGRDMNCWYTGFGPSNVVLHELSTSLDLGDVAKVLEHGLPVRVGALPVERATAHHIDMARALSYAARDEEATIALVNAEAKAPQLVRRSASARETIRTIYRRTPAKSERATLISALAGRCQAMP